MDKKKVVVGMSGGVDSSVSTYLLKKSGYEVIGVTLNHKKEKFLEEEVNTARRIADFIGVKHIEVDIEELFQKEVINNFIEGYSKGITPSPCVICDERVKFKALFDVAEKEGAYYVATGHYCSKAYNEEFQQMLLTVGKDKKKDQSYMLSRLTSNEIERILFPLYEYTKDKIRELAREINLEVSDKKDSQGICFAKRGHIEFLTEKLQDKIKKGYFKDRNGNILGEHQGYQIYTLGQRRGLNIKQPRPYFIVEIIPEKNEIILGEYKELGRTKIQLLEYKEVVELERLKGKELVGKPRFSSEGAPGKIYKDGENIIFEYLDENYHNAPGQHLVLYYNNFIVGSGIIN